MSAPRRRRVLVGLGGLVLAVLGFVAGAAVERVRFDQHRAAVLRGLAATRNRLHTHLLDLERRTESRRPLDVP